MAEFDYDAAAELFPTRRRVPRRQWFGYRRFAKPLKPSVSQWRTCRQHVWSARFSKLMSRDTTATMSAVCMKAPNIR